MGAQPSRGLLRHVSPFIVTRVYFDIFLTSDYARLLLCRGLRLQLVTWALRVEEWLTRFFLVYCRITKPWQRHLDSPTPAQAFLISVLFRPPEPQLMLYCTLLCCQYRDSPNLPPFSHCKPHTDHPTRNPVLLLQLDRHASHTRSHAPLFAQTPSPTIPLAVPSLSPL